MDPIYVIRETLSRNKNHLTKLAGVRIVCLITWLVDDGSRKSTCMLLLHVSSQHQLTTTPKDACVAVERELIKVHYLFNQFTMVFIHNMSFQITITS